MRSLAILLVGCAASPHPSNGTHSASWSDGASDSPGVPDPVICTDVVSHPCPWLVYTGELLVSGTTVTWTAASGGANDIGVDASAEPDVVEVARQADGGLQLPSRGDDGGLRESFVLHPTACGGWQADVTWLLFNVAGKTTFHLEVTP